MTNLSDADVIVDKGCFLGNLHQTAVIEEIPDGEVAMPEISIEHLKYVATPEEYADREQMFVEQLCSVGACIFQVQK